MALRRYWRAHPPVHLLVAGFMGFKPALETPDLPDGAFAEAASKNADWFADPARFFKK